jgi:glycine cleavage system H protein
MTIVLVMLTIIITVLLDVLLVAHRRVRAREARGEVEGVVGEPHIPQGVFLDNGHAWVRVTSEGTLRVGVDQLLADLLGQVDEVKLLARGTRVRRGDPLIRLRVGGRELVMRSPVAGDVVLLNERVRERPWLAAWDPYGAGWMVGMWSRDLKSAITPLRVGGGATAFLRAELGRIIDFVSRAHAPATSPVFGDGALLRRGALTMLDNEAWERFQEQFLVIA